MKIVGTFVLFISLIIIGGCLPKAPSPSPATDGTERWPVNRIWLVEKDGVQCMVFASANKGGISCNWDRYNRELALKMLEEY